MAVNLLDKPPSPEQISEEPKPPEPTPEELARKVQEARERALKEREKALNPERIREAIQAYREEFPNRVDQLKAMKDDTILKLLARVICSEDPDYISVAGLIGVAVLNRWKNANKGENERSFWRVVMGKAKEFGPQDEVRKYFSTDIDPNKDKYEEHLLLADMLLQTGEFAEIYKNTIKAEADNLLAQAHHTRSPKQAARLRNRAQDMLHTHLIDLREKEIEPGDKIGAYLHERRELSGWRGIAERFQFLQTMFLHVAAQQKYYEDYEAKKARGEAQGATLYRSPAEVIEKWEKELGVRMINIPLGQAGIEGDPDKHVRFGVIVGDLDKEGLREDEFSEYMKNDALLAACFAPPSAKRVAA